MTKLKSTFILKKLSSLLMHNGKKKMVFKKVIKTLQNFNIKNLCILTSIFHRNKPILETKKIRKGSKFYEVPFFLKKSRSLSLILRWTAKSIQKQGFNQELKDLIHDAGSTIKECKLLRNKVVANIIYSHYRWK